MGVETVIFMIGTYALTWGTVYTAIATSLISFGISYAAQALFGVTPETPDFSSSINDNIDGAVNPIPVVYGRRLIGGTRVLVDTTGTDNKFLHTVLTLAEGEVYSIEDITLNDISITDAKYADHAWGYKHTGADNQTVDASLNGLMPDKWTENHRLQGIAYVYVRLKFNQDVFSSIPTILADVKGKKVYDPRTQTTGWSDNPALCIRDYLTNTRYGRGIPESLIDDDAIIASANYCEQQITFYDPTGSSYTDNRYRCNGAVNPDDGYLENVKKLLSSCRGMLIFSAGKYKLVIDKPETASFTFDEDNIVGAVNIGMGDKAVVFNRMRIGYFDKDLKWEQNYFTYDNPTLRDNQDNGLVLEGSLDLPFTNEIVRVEQIAQLEVKRSRQSIVCSFASTLESLQCDVGDVVNVNYARAGWVNKKFRVVKIGLKSEDTVDISLKEYDASVYTIEAWTPPDEPDTLNPGLWNYDPPNNVSAASGNTELLLAGDGSLISRIRLSWTAPENGYCTGFEAGYKLSSESAYTDFAKGSGEVEHVFSPVQDGVNYDLRVRAVYFTGGHSAWVYSLAHTVAGKSALPDTPTGFVVTNEANNVKKFVWNAVTNLDLRGYRIRYKTGSTGEWADMTSLHSGNLAGSPWETSSISATGDHRFGLVSVDTSGNESLPVYYNLTLETTGSGSSTPPGAPSGLSTTAMFKAILLEWTNPIDAEFYRAEIWASETNNRSTAAVVATTGAQIIAIPRETTTPFYFWVRAININGVPGAFDVGDTAGTQGAALIELTSSDYADLSVTSAKIASLVASKITAGTIGAHTIQLDGSSSIIQSSNFVTGTSGWQIKGNGVAEFLDAIIRGTVSSGGAIQSSNFQAGVQGWRIDGSGNAEFNTVEIYGSVDMPEVFYGATQLTSGSEYINRIDSVTVNVSVQAGCSAYYTVDGTTPTETSDAVPESGNVTVSGGVTLKVKAFEDLTGRSSPMFSAVFNNYLPICATKNTASEKHKIRTYEYNASYLGESGSNLNQVRWSTGGTSSAPPSFTSATFNTVFPPYAASIYYNADASQNGLVYDTGVDDGTAIWFIAGYVNPYALEDVVFQYQSGSTLKLYTIGQGVFRTVTILDKNPENFPNSF